MTETPKNDSAPDGGSAPGAPAGRPVPPLVQGDMRIARDGTWYHEGTPFKRLPLVKLFSTVDSALLGLYDVERPGGGDVVGFPYDSRKNAVSMATELVEALARRLDEPEREGTARECLHETSARALRSVRIEAIPPRTEQTPNS